MRFLVFLGLAIAATCVSAKPSESVPTTPEPVSTVSEQIPLAVGEYESFPRKPCTPGKPLKIYCNYCSCGPDGFPGVCTLMACPKGIWNEDGSLKNPGPLAAVPYPNSNSDEQVSTVAKPTVVSSSPLLRNNLQISHNRPCEAGKRFNIYCNECTCGSDGFSVSCTRMACNPEIWNEDGSLKHPESVPTTSEPVFNGSNQVSSSSEHVSSVSDKFENGPLLRKTRQVSYDRPCEAGKAFKIYCNQCGCGADGHSVICSKMECAPGIWNEDGTLINPVPEKENPLLRSE